MKNFLLRSNLLIPFGCLLWLILVVGACKKDAPYATPLSEQDELLNLPLGFMPPMIPEDNQLTKLRVALGKRLFYDPIMSRDSSISCGNCHKQRFAFADSVALSPGVAGAPGTRNAPSLANVAYHPYLLREGGLPTLEMQVLVPIQEHNEFDFNIVLIAERMKNDPSYAKQCADAYSREPDAFCITRALSAFQRTLISGRSRYDDFAIGGKYNALSAAEHRGKELYFSPRANCGACHAGYNLTAYSFENNGLYEEYTDPGRFRLTGDSVDIARFKVPSLRNIALTAPYMHDGSLASLEAVLAHYNSGGKAHPQKNNLVKPLGLSVGELSDLKAFLESFTDSHFISNPAFERD